jgi:hypothetical protein
MRGAPPPAEAAVSIESTPVMRDGVPAAYSERSICSSSPVGIVRTAGFAAWSITPAESMKNCTRGAAPTAAIAASPGGYTCSSTPAESAAARNVQPSRRAGMRAASAANTRATASSATVRAATGTASATSTSPEKHSSSHTTQVRAASSVAVDPTRADGGTCTAPSRCTSRS